MSVRTGVDEYNQPTSDINSGYVGEFKYFGFESVPPHCLACDGSEVSRETYSELFAVFGTTFGAGDGVNTFNLPDLRGAFLRCIGGNAAELGTEQGDAIRNISGTFGIKLEAAVGSPWLGYVTGSNQDNAFTPVTFEGGISLRSTATQSINNAPVGVSLSAARQVPTANENRPVNMAVNICVVFE